MAVDLLNLPSLRAIELREEAKTGNVVLAEITTTTECCPHCLRDHFHGHGVKEWSCPGFADRLALGSQAGSVAASVVVGAG